MKVWFSIVHSTSVPVKATLYVIPVRCAIKYTLPLSSAQSHEIGVVAKSNSASAPDKDQYKSSYPVFVTLGIVPVKALFSVIVPVQTSSSFDIKKRFKVLGSLA